MKHTNAPTYRPIVRPNPAKAFINLMNRPDENGDPLWFDIFFIIAGLFIFTQGTYFLAPLYWLGLI